MTGREETAPEKRGRHLRGRQIALAAAASIIYVIAAAVVVFIVHDSGIYPAGSDTMYHIHRAELVYNSICAGNWWPGYDPTWYNGVEILRYWPPLAPYLMAACQAVAAGNIWAGYLLFVGILVVGSSIPWLYIGYRMDRPWLGAFLGLVWFFLPNNLYQLFTEGNIPRALSMCFLPLYAYNVAAFLKDEKRRNFVGISVCFSLMVLCHLGYAGMLALATLLFMLVYCLANRRLRVALRAVLAMLLGFLLVGVWLVPSLFGGISNIDSSATMKSFFQSLGVSLDPFARLQTTLLPYTVPYIGLPGFVLAVIGALFSNRKAAPGFITAALICVLTSTAAMPFLAALPGGGLLWMMRFVSIALCLILISLLQWRRLKTPFLIAFCVLAVLDCIPSLRLIYGYQTGEQPVERLSQQQKETLVEEAKRITTQRLCVLQEGTRVIDAYVLTDLGGTTNQVFGAGWEASTTSRNIALLNRASNEGDFLYLFDRAKELGADTVLMNADVVENPEPDMAEQLDGCAERTGYELVNTSGAYRLYHLSAAPETFGVKTHYPAIAIGKNSDAIALSYPAFRQTADPNLNHYSFDELSRYRVVYLTGFTYDDQQAAESLVLQLASSGVRVVVSADDIPENKNSHDRIFLGVRCNTVRFSNGFPDLHTKDGILDTNLFPSDMSTWNTVYLEGLNDSLGYADLGNGTHVDFMGTAGSDNIVFVGFNLAYFCSLTHDEGVGALLSRAMDLDPDELPERELVPIALSYGPDAITVTSPEDDVNTTLAYHDLFDGVPGVRDSFHLTVVDSGTTKLPLGYPYLWQGIAASVLGAVCLVAFSHRSHRGKEPDNAFA